MRKGSIVVALALLVLGTGVLGAGASGVAPAKKRCHFVKKKVHGKVKRVRVCTKPKPKPKPKVLNVSLSLDSTHAASVVVGDAGGTVTAHEADGSTTTLTVPAGALAGDTTITLTPVDSLRGLPKGLKLGAGVQFGPEGLALAKPATVSLSAGGATRGIAWFATGKAVSRYPAQSSGSSVTMTVTHFSGVGAVSGPASAYADIPSAIAALRARYTSAVRPLLQQAVTNDAVAGAAMNEAFGLLREVELLGLGSEFDRERGEIMDFLPRILQNALNAASEKCANHDLTQLTQLTQIERTAQLLGIELSGGSAVERILKCAQFDLEYDSHTGIRVPGAVADSHVRATIHLRPSADLSHITGQADLELIGGGHSACGPATDAHTINPIVVADLDIDVATHEVVLTMDPGNIQATVTCGTGDSFPNGYTYFSVWYYLHTDELVTTGIFALKNWSWVGGAVVATKSYSRTAAAPGGGDGTFFEDTTLTLRHTPQP
jgi:hypothetical protein